MKVFSHFGNSEIVRIGSPYSAVIDIPTSSCIVHQDNVAKIIHEHFCIAYLERFIARIGMRTEWFYAHVKASQVGSKRISLTLSSVTLVLNWRYIQTFELVFRRGFRDYGTVYFRTGVYGITDSDLSVCSVTCHSVPLITHQTGRTEYAVNLLFYAAAPKCEHWYKSHISVRLGVIAFFPAAFHKSLELVARCWIWSVFYDLFVCKIRNGRAGKNVLYRWGAFHESVKHRLQSFIVAGYAAGTVYITCDCHETVCSAGEIDFQPVLAVVDIIHRLIVSEIWREAEETTQACRAWRTLKICIREKGENRCSYIV